jgi:hypothetical protein
MLHWILNSISNYRKSKDQKKEITQNINEILEKFESYFMETFGYDGCIRAIEDYSKFNLNSNFVNSIISKKRIIGENFENEFQFKKFIFLNLDHPEPNEKIVVFRFYRKNSKHIYEYFELICSFIKNKENIIKIIFLNFDQQIFNHYYFNGRIEEENTFNLKYTDIDSFFDYIYISNISSYFYDVKENKIVYIINLPVIKVGSDQLNFKILDSKSFLSTNKPYSIEFYLDINSNNFCEKYKCTLYYGEHIIREFDFDIYTYNDFIKASEKLLFPFFLTKDKKIELGLENVYLEKIKNTFDIEFELYKKYKL